MMALREVAVHEHAADQEVILVIARGEIHHTDDAGDGVQVCRGEAGEILRIIISRAVHIGTFTQPRRRRSSSGSGGHWIDWFHGAPET
jgi:hypothetical protein